MASMGVDPSRILQKIQCLMGSSEGRLREGRFQNDYRK